MVCKGSGTVWEKPTHRLPILNPMDMFRGLTSTNGEIKVSDWGRGFVFSEGGEESGEDDIKIDSCPCKDMFPFRFRERQEDTTGLE